MLPRLLTVCCISLEFYHLSSARERFAVSRQMNIITSCDGDERKRVMTGRRRDTEREAERRRWQTDGGGKSSVYTTYNNNNNNNNIVLAYRKPPTGAQMNFRPPYNKTVLHRARTRRRAGCICTRTRPPLDSAVMYYSLRWAATRAPRLTYYTRTRMHCARRFFRPS
jgi:hypothetical protein